MRRLMATALACAALAGCAGIPTDGPVRAGDTEVEQPGPFVPLLQGPEKGASPQAIVRGFLSASAGGAVQGFEVAREYLTDEAAVEWDPLAHVTVYDSRQVEPSYDESTATYTYRVPVAAAIDDSGVMTEAMSDVTADFTFGVTRVDGEYRISTLDDGIVMSEADFERFFRPLRLYFATANSTTLVPELRWFANNDQIATAVTRELIDGPSVWLADAVRTGFPPASALDVDAVVMDGDVATVALAPSSAGDASDRALASAQLDLTLGQLASVQRVETTVGGVPLSGGEVTQLDPAPLPPEQAAVIVDGRLGLFDGNQVRVTPADVGVVPAGASGLALAYDGTTVAMVVDGSVVTSTAISDAPGLDPFVDETESLQDPAVIPTTTVMAGSRLVAPSFDPQGWLWSSESASGGEVLAAIAGQEPLSLAAPWLAGRSVQALAVSRDGTRLAVLSRATGDQQTLEVAAIVRDENGVPLGLGQPLPLAPSVAASVDVAWADDVSLLTLGQDAGEIQNVVVGGWAVPEASVQGATVLTARNGVRTMLAVTGDGALQVGTSATVKAHRVSDVAYAG